MSPQSTNISSPHRTFIVVGICIAIALIASVIALIYGYHTWIAPQFADGLLRDTITETRGIGTDIVKSGTIINNHIDGAVETYQETKETVENTAAEITEAKDAAIGLQEKLKNLFSNETKTEATIAN